MTTEHIKPFTEYEFDALHFKRMGHPQKLKLIPEVKGVKTKLCWIIDEDGEPLAVTPLKAVDFIGEDAPEGYKAELSFPLVNFIRREFEIQAGDYFKKKGNYDLTNPISDYQIFIGSVMQNRKDLEERYYPMLEFMSIEVGKYMSNKSYMFLHTLMPEEDWGVLAKIRDGLGHTEFEEPPRYLRDPQFSPEVMKEDEIFEIDVSFQLGLSIAQAEADVRAGLVPAIIIDEDFMSKYEYSREDDDGIVLNVKNSYRQHQGGMKFIAKKHSQFDDTLELDIENVAEWNLNINSDEMAEIDAVAAERLKKAEEKAKERTFNEQIVDQHLLNKENYKESYGISTTGDLLSKVRSDLNLGEVGLLDRINLEVDIQDDSEDDS